MPKYLRERVRKTGVKQREERARKWLAYCRRTFNILHLVSSDTLHPLRVTDWLLYISPHCLLTSLYIASFVLRRAYFLGVCRWRSPTHLRASYFSESHRAALKGHGYLIVAFARSSIYRPSSKLAVMKSASRYLCASHGCCALSTRTSR